MSPSHLPLIETFPALEGVPFLRHGFTLRVPGLDVKTDRETALRRLAQFHQQARETLGLREIPFVTAEQVHGAEVAIFQPGMPIPVPGADGLLTDAPGVCLGIYVADCCAVYLVDPERRSIGLIHAGRKGAHLGIVSVAIEKMRSHFGCDPRRMIAHLSPCIRPPLYEVDIPAEILRQCQAAGIWQVHDPGANTGADLDRYYSYRVERGETGRMLALLGMND